MPETSVPIRPLQKAYDYIVVGSGSGGSPVIRRLIDGTDATVLLIEAGEPGIGVAEIEDPREWVPLGRGRWDWGYDYAPSPLVNGRTIGIPRGKVLGGSSATNALMWYRGNPLDYDAWETAGCEGWSFRDVLPYFKRAEDWEGGETTWRGAGGPLKITTSRMLHPVARAMLEGAPEVGIPVIADPNAATNEGACPSNFNVLDGKRWSSAKGYLHPILENERLTILTGSQAIGLVIENGRCTGVRHLVDGKPVTTLATTQVVLAAGAIDTPRLLMLSGIGDPAELARLGIPLIHALPGVGRNLQDHPLVQAVVCRSKKPLGPKTDNGGGTMLNWKSRPNLKQPDVHSFPVQGNSAETRLRELYDMSGEVFSMGAGLMHSKSVGYLRMLTADPSGPLEIQPNYLAEQSDLDALVSAVGTVMDLAETTAFAEIFDGFVAPDRRLTKTETVEFVRNGCSTFFHPCGTAKMGKDEMSVVDARLSVHGLHGLTISDASVIPIIPTCNTHAPVTMIGERVADFLMGAA
ncbi:GMC family oxidoreductase N-terminal domain-containing protein [Ciceribacter sp. L1K23]|uniref:GMC family oxidoreductase n=1 Tax=Ciceribacter sp. L1K23 TaxID=2820276 RepID=UPI001B82D3D1|nr:GMC family oxidoreductase N-terminal domain-containing protein [Ciceribacter sp. L1K23]MBR0557974.1 GMC family oxidoreductase N-terminal domain-containing protein [Ciceribacter sp. L1K23]